MILLMGAALPLVCRAFEVSIYVVGGRTVNDRLVQWPSERGRGLGS